MWCGKWFIQEQHFRLINYCSGNCHALLLTTGQRIYIAVLIVGHTNGFKGLFDLGDDNSFVEFFEFQSEGHIIEYIKMREEGVFLEYCIDGAFVRRCLGYILAFEQDVAGRSHLKACYATEQGRLAAT